MSIRGVLKAIDSALGVGLNIQNSKKTLEEPRAKIVEAMFQDESNLFKQVNGSIKNIQKQCQKKLEERDGQTYTDIQFQAWRTIFTQQVEGILSVSRVVGKSLIFRKKTIDSISGQMAYLSVQQRTLMRCVLSTYFESGDDMALIFYNMNLVAKRGKGLFGGAISGVGPILMKMFQQVGNAPTGSSNSAVANRLESLAEIMEDVFSNTPKMSDAEKEVVWKNLAKDATIKEYLGEEFKNVDRKKPLGSASLAEAYKVTREGEKKAFVLKFIRPIYMVYFLAEAERLLGRTWTNIENHARIEMMRDGGETPTERDLQRIVYQTRGLILFTIKEVAKEFDYEQEVKNTLQGHKLYNRLGRDKGIKSVDIVACPKTPDTTVPCMLQNYAEGSIPLDKYMKQLKQDKKMEQKTKELIYKRVYELIYSLSEIWNRNLIFESGFGHFDLHAGNILVTNAIRTTGDVEKIELFLIDFGSAGCITKREQYFMLRAAITASRMKSLHDCLTKKHRDENRDNINWLDDNQEEVSDMILSYFRSPMTQVERNRVKLHVAGDPEKFRKIHRRNLLLLCDFEEYVWKLCQNRQDEIPEKVILETLNYSRGVKMSNLFLRLAGRALSMANCMSSNVLWMGKGGAYLQSLTDKLYAMCPETACESFSVDNYLAGQTWSAAKLLIRGYVQFDRSIFTSRRCKSVKPTSTGGTARTDAA